MLGAAVLRGLSNGTRLARLLRGGLDPSRRAQRGWIGRPVVERTGNLGSRAFHQGAGPFGIFVDYLRRWFSTSRDRQRGLRARSEQTLRRLSSRQPAV